MDQSILSQMFPYLKRQKMREQPSFKEIQQFLETNNFNTSEKFGDVQYMIWRMHESLNNKEQGEDMKLVQFSEWLEQYFGSGKKRLENKEGFRNKYQQQMQNGRTEQEIWQVSAEIREQINTTLGFRITEQAAFNIVITLILDDAFHQYMRTVLFVILSKKRWPNFVFKMTDSSTKKEFDIDVLVYKDRELYKGLVMKSPLDQEKRNGSKEEMKNIKFSEIHGVQVEKVTISYSGDIFGELPLFLR